jgi:sodium transport system ATP-binding protein
MQEAAAAPLVFVDALVKRYGDVCAVDGLTFQVQAGEVYGLLGPNGAGKTTALRILAGLLAPTSGRAWLAGLDASVDGDAVKARVGFMSTSTGLYLRLTVRELLRYFGGLQGLRGDGLAGRIDTLARTLDLLHLLGRRCEALSTGERQRVSIARALLHDPPVLILDEPTSGLDVLASQALRDFVLAARDLGKAIIFSTHYLAEAELLCDRVGLLHRGRLLREGPPSELRAETGASSLELAFLRLVQQAPASAVTG